MDKYKNICICICICICIVYLYVYVHVHIHIHIYETCSIKEILQLLRRSESNAQPLDRHVPGVWYLATTCAIFAVSR